MKRYDIINKLIERHEYSDYLEIGIRHGESFRAVRCDRKTGVDPDPSPGMTSTVLSITSDEFFANNTNSFDIVFIDGLHEADQVERDILNSLKVLNSNGCIVCHDMNPIEEIHQKVPMESTLWNGDCWKAWVRLRSVLENKHMFVVDTDHGCGVIRAGTQSPISIPDPLTYEYLDGDRRNVLNLISVSDFLSAHL